MPCGPVITGIRTIVYAADAEKARAFFRDAPEFAHADAGRDRHFFALTPGEIAAHPAEGKDSGRCEPRHPVAIQEV
jgi:hypothetical protein